MRIEEMVQRKRELGYTARQVADLSGVPLSTVQKVLGGHTKSPRYETLRALEKVLRQGTPEHEDMQAPALVREEAIDYQAFAHGGRVASTDESTRGSMQRPGAPEKKQGEYTVEDYESFPEERRVEMIDGVIYDMTAPTGVHQIITEFIFAELWNYIRIEGGECVVNIAPTSVRLDPADNRTIVEPDVLVTCDRAKLTRRGIEGAPDLIVEVLSPSTRRRDMFLKAGKYGQAGVRELWLVDPRDLRIVVYDFEHEDTVSMYTFRDFIPVQIFHGELTINFPSLAAYLSDLYGQTWWEE